jgi:hypothetical protein
MWNTHRAGGYPAGVLRFNLRKDAWSNPRKMRDSPRSKKKSCSFSTT